MKIIKQNLHKLPFKAKILVAKLLLFNSKLLMRCFKGFGRKCRAEYAKVIEIIGADKAISEHDNSFIYKVGDIVGPTTPFDEDFTNECSTGIHFFITLEEAKNY